MNKKIIKILIVTMVASTITPFGKSIKAEEMAPYTFYEYTTHPERYIENGAEEIKYFAFHETGNFGATARRNADNFKNNPAVKTLDDGTVIYSYTSAKIIIDDKEAFKMMDYDDMEYAVGGGTPLRDILNENSISIEIAVGDGIDFHRAVANAIYYYRNEIKPLYPNLEVVRHYDAVGKNCPMLINEEVSWWTWDRVKEYCNNDEPIPFIDFVPVDSEDEKFILKKSDYVVEETGAIRGSFPVKNIPTIREVKDGKVSNIYEKTKMISEESESDDEDVLPVKEYKESKISKLFGFFKKETKEEVKEDPMMKDIPLEGYVEIPWDVIYNYIKEKNPEIKLADEVDFIEHMQSYAKSCEIENINPWTFMLQPKMTSNFKFGGIVKKEQHNYAGLKTSEGDFISFANNHQGNMAIAQCFSKALGRKKMMVEFKNPALDNINLGGAKTVREYCEMLGFQPEFTDSLIKTINELNSK